MLRNYPLWFSQLRLRSVGAMLIIGKMSGFLEFLPLRIPGVLMKGNGFGTLDSAQDFIIDFEVKYGDDTADLLPA